jgi:hypothetical protein
MQEVSRILLPAARDSSESANGIADRISAYARITLQFVWKWQGDDLNAKTF